MDIVAFIGKWYAVCRKQNTYEYFENINFVDESCIILELLLLNGLYSVLLVAFSVLSQVDNTESAIGQLLLEGVDLFDVSFSRVDEVLRLWAGGRTCCTGTACTLIIHARSARHVVL